MASTSVSLQCFVNREGEIAVVSGRVLSRLVIIHYLDDNAARLHLSPVIPKVEATRERSDIKSFAGVLRLAVGREVPFDRCNVVHYTPFMARPKGTRKTARFSVSLDDKAHRELRAFAVRDDVSIAWLIRRAVNEMIERWHKQPQGKVARDS